MACSACRRGAGTCDRAALIVSGGAALRGAISRHQELRLPGLPVGVTVSVYLSIIKYSKRGPFMIRNFILVTFRRIARYRYFALINLLGLALGFCCSIFLALWILDELKYDRFHAHGTRLFRVLKRDFFAEGRVEVYPQGPGILIDALKAEIPEIEMGTQMSWDFRELLTVGDESHKESGRFVQPDFLGMFSFPLVSGDPATALDKPTSIVISEKLARKYFSREDPIGKLVKVRNREEYQVTAVMKDVPRNSSVQFDYLLHWDVFLAQNEWAKEWDNNAPRAFVMLRDPAQRAAVDAKIKDFVHQRVKDPKTDISELFLQPYGEAYLYGTFTNGEQDGGRIDYVRSFGIVAIVVLVIACINFMNLATAQSLRRSREIGVRKATGAGRRLLVAQFLGEALVYAFFGAGLSVLLVELSLPAFRTLTDKPVEVPYADPIFMTALVGVTILAGVLAGGYPAFFLSSFDAVKALKGNLRFGAGPVLFRKGLVVFQFSLTILLIFCTLVVYRQIEFIKAKNLGFEKDNLVVVDFEAEHVRKMDVIVSETSRLPGIASVTVSTTPPLASGNSTTAVEWPGKKDDLQMAITQMGVGYDYLATMGIQLKEGRDFSRDYPADSAAYVVNEEAVRKMNLTDPIGQEITFWSRKGPIIGVMKDYHIGSFHESIEPIILHLHPEWSNQMIARLEAGRTSEALEGIGKVMTSMAPAYPFEYRFADDSFDQLYKGESTVGVLANYFSVMAIFISCLGLLGLIMFAAAQRAKEIGVRKVLGASVPSLFGLLSRDFLILVGVAFVFSSPLAWYVMQDWLAGFAYRTEIGAPVFVLSGAVAGGIALLTISYQAVKAALENPVKALRSE